MSSATSKFVLDSHAWIEYFKGSEKGEKIRAIVEGGNSYTPILVLTEITYWYAKQNAEHKDRIDFITTNSTIVKETVDIAVKAGMIKKLVRKKYKNNFGTIDAIILATARSLKAITITGDYHFKPLKNVEYIGDVSGK